MRCLPPGKARLAFWVGSAAVITLFGLLAMRSLVNYVAYFGMYHDDALYLVTARALAEGHGYTTISLPGEPPQTKYPPGFPLLLSLLWNFNPVFPQNLPALSLVQIAIAGATAISTVAYLLLTRKATPLLALVVLSACLLNSHYIDFAPMLMSDMLYGLTSVLAIWGTEKLARGKPSARAAILIGLIWTMPFWFRQQGLIAIAAGVIYLCLRRQRRLALLAAGLALSLISPFMLWQWSAARSSPEFLVYYTHYLGHAYNTLPKETVSHLLSNWHWSGVMQVNTYLPFLARIPYDKLPPLAFELIFRVGYLLVGLPLPIGGVRDAMRRRLAAIYCIFGAVALATFPLKLEWRHIMTTLAFNYFFYIQGLRVLGYWLKGRLPLSRGTYRRLCALSAVAFSIYLVGGSAVEALQKAGRYGAFFAQGRPWAGAAIQAFDQAESFAWLEKHTSPADCLVSNNDPLLFLYTGRKAVFPSRMEMWRFAESDLVDSESMLEAIRFARARYVVVDPTYRFLGRATLQSALAVGSLNDACPGLLTHAYTSSHGLVHIYAVDLTRLPRASNVR